MRSFATLESIERHKRARRVWKCGAPWFGWLWPSPWKRRRKPREGKNGTGSAGDAEAKVEGPVRMVENHRFYLFRLYGEDSAAAWVSQLSPLKSGVMRLLLLPHLMSGRAGCVIFGVVSISKRNELSLRLLLMLSLLFLACYGCCRDWHGKRDASSCTTTGRVQYEHIPKSRPGDDIWGSEEIIKADQVRAHHAGQWNSDRLAMWRACSFMEIVTEKKRAKERRSKREAVPSFPKQMKYSGIRKSRGGRRHLPRGLYNCVSEWRKGLSLTEKAFGRLYEAMDSRVP